MVIITIGITKVSTAGVNFLMFLKSPLITSLKAISAPLVNFFTIAAKANEKYVPPSFEAIFNVSKAISLDSAFF